MFCDFFCFCYDIDHKTNIESQSSSFGLESAKTRGKPSNGNMREVPILIAPNWEKEFHVHMDASNLVVGAMLAQNLDSKCD